MRVPLDSAPPLVLQSVILRLEQALEYYGLMPRKESPHEE